MPRSALLPLLFSAVLLSCGGEENSWRLSSQDTAPLLNHSTGELSLSDKVPREAVELALRVSSVGSDSTAPFLSPIEWWNAPACTAPTVGISSRPIHTGSFPAFDIRVSLGCPEMVHLWGVTVTSQLRITRAWRDSLAME